MELVYFVLAGVVAGYLANKLMKMNLDMVPTILVGIVGGFVGGWGLAQLGIMLPWGMVGEVITAVFGAVVLLYLYKMVTK